VFWSWGPANSRLDHLFLSLDRSRKYYLLWFEWADDGYSDSRAVAYMAKGKLDSRQAASALLFAFYRGEEQEFVSENGRWTVSSAGLLSGDELISLAALIWPQSQRDESSSTGSNTPSPEMRVMETAPAQPHSAIDVLTLAEVMLKREAGRAFSGLALSIGDAFLRAAQALEACVQTLTEADVSGVHALARRGAAARHALDALSRLESRLPQSPGRFDELYQVLQTLAEQNPVEQRSRREPFPHDEADVESVSTREPQGALDLVREDELDDLEEQEPGGPVRVGELIRFPDPSDFDPVQLEGRIEDARLDELLAGARATPEEMALWTGIRMREHGGEPPRYHIVTLWEHVTDVGSRLVWANLHEDQGTVWERIGPCRTRAEVEQVLASMGQLSWNPW
jgi:hypothetical protein